jgi:para-aminobenzoate synthetase component 1
MVAVSYELGRVLEPKVGLGRPGTSGALLHELVCDDVLVYDHVGGVWWGVGEPPELEGRDGVGGFVVSALVPEVSREAYESGVGRVLEYIRAGDVYQVNLAHRMAAEFSGSTRAFFTVLMRAAGAWYGAYLETAEGVIASASPEMFLSYNPETRRLTTRPMKGTRPVDREQELRASGKDAAELNMITDLMRNDLGRVCELGSVRVEASRVIERHNRLAQTTSTVSGVLRAGLNAGDALASAFPGGSVTGCPKIRAMQVIDELEESPREFYCGSIGYFSRSGHAAFNIAIRTAMIHGSRLTYHAGAGIVIDSDPAAEWQETLDKAGIMTRVAQAASERLTGKGDGHA